MSAPPALTTTLSSVRQSSFHPSPLQTKTVCPPFPLPSPSGPGVAMASAVSNPQHLISCGLPAPSGASGNNPFSRSGAQASVSCRDAHGAQRCLFLAP